MGGTAAAVIACRRYHSRAADGTSQKDEPRSSSAIGRRRSLPKLPVDLQIPADNGGGTGRLQIDPFFRIWMVLNPLTLFADAAARW
jgi:hypothetical protein